MKIKEILKIAITKGDWQLLCDTYEAVTGEKIDPPKQTSESKEENEFEIDIDLVNKKRAVGRGKKECPQCHKLIGSRTKICPNCKHDFFITKNLNNNDTISKTKNDPMAEFRMPQRNKKPRFNPPPTKGQRRPNLFNQNNLSELHKEQRVDKNPDNLELGIGSVRKRIRQPPHKVKIQCSICNKKFEEYSSVLNGRSSETWKCNKCLINMRV